MNGEFEPTEFHMKTHQLKIVVAGLICQLACLTACFAQSDATDRTVRGQKKTLIAASNMLHPPFSSWSPDKQAIGIEVDIVNAAAAEMSQQVQWVEKPFGELIDAVAAGEIDVAVSTIGITDERKQKVGFSRSYFETKIVALVSPGSEFDSLDSLREARIGADKATTSFGAAKARWPEATFIGAVKEGMKWPEMIEAGLLDAFIVDGSDQSRLESQSSIKLYRLEEPLVTERFAIVMNKRGERLRAAVNSQIKKQRSTIELRIGGELQFKTPTGRQLTSTEAPPAKLVENYLKARAQYRAQPDDADSVIWYGRRAGYLLRLNEAIQIFSIGIEKHPEDARMYRHRGHRYVSTRQFDKAIADLEKAVTLIDGKADKSEPDGAPNPQGIELTTTHGNIWYHLGLAYYLKNDMFNAQRCFGQCLKIAGNDDGIVSSSHWQYMILRRMGQYKRATKLVASISPAMNIIENKTYHQMCLLYGGKTTAADLLKPNKPDSTTDENHMRQSVADVLLYGIGNWHEYHRGDKRQSREMYEQLLAGGSPFSFAFIAAESDYMRMFVGR